MSADEDRVLSANESFYAAFATADFARMDELWAREQPVTCIHPGWNALIGRTAVMASWRAILESGNTRLEPSEARAHVVGDAAYVVCFEGTRGEAPFLIATNIFAREQGLWKLIHHHAGQMARRHDPVAAGPTN